LSVQNAEDIFAEVVDRVKVLDPANSRKWFEHLTLLDLEGGLLKVGCQKESMVQYLRQRCRNNFTRAAQQVTGYLVSVEFELAGEQAERKEAAAYGIQLNPDYIFENFVVGPSNRLAHASCVAVSQSLGNTYNPLFLYGNSGLGKTHLLHAVSDAVQRRCQGAVIQVLSCEDFVNRFIRAIEEGNLVNFQNEFRTVDALIIDDVQFLREREQSQQEFFHTFNALYNSGKQIILSADSAPAEIASLGNRLTSRFNWGLVARIDPPSHETRVAIVQKKAHLRDLDISEEIAEYIARKVRANIRELEGALTAIYAMATTTGEEVTLKMARTVLEGQIAAEAKPINISDIIDVVTRHFGVRLSDLQSKKRSQSITEPRQICMYMARKLTRHSLEEIGGHLGGRDHTTVMHACSKIAKAKDNDPEIHAVVEQLMHQVTEPGTA